MVCDPTLSYFQILRTGCEEDIRIAALHGYKLAATSQHNAAVGSGIQLLKIIPGAGHETGKSIDILYVVSGTQGIHADYGPCIGLKRML